MKSKLDQIRDQLPAVQRTAFLNVGTCGPLPTVVAEAMAEAARHELEIGRGDIAAYIAFKEKVDQARAALGRLFSVDGSAIALTHHTSEGMNIVLIRNIPHEPYCLRVSTGFYNTAQELIGLRDALGELLEAGPDAVGIPDTALELPDEPVM